MTFNQSILPLLTAFFFGLVCPQMLFALCDEYSADRAAKSFQFSYNCKNTSTLVDYQIIRQITHWIDYRFFQFDRRGWNVICTSLEYKEKEIFSDCQSYGIKKKTEFNLENNSLKLNFNTRREELMDVYAKTELYKFIFPEHLIEFETYQCAIVSKEGSLQVFIKNSDISNLSECLLRYELSHS
jgi:hypothetical protein